MLWRDDAMISDARFIFIECLYELIMIMYLYLLERLLVSLSKFKKIPEYGVFFYLDMAQCFWSKYYEDHLYKVYQFFFFANKSLHLLEYRPKDVKLSDL